MPRVKRGPKRKNRRVRVLELAKGYYGTKHNCFRIAELQVERSLVYATRDRKQKKREFRGLWIVRINAAARQHDLSYSKLMAGLKKAGSDVNRKVLAEIAVEDPKGFANIVASAKTALGLPAGRPRPRAPRSASSGRSARLRRRETKSLLRRVEDRRGEGFVRAGPPPGGRARAARALARPEAGRRHGASRGAPDPPEGRQGRRPAPPSTGSRKTSRLRSLHSKKNLSSSNAAEAARPGRRRHAAAPFSARRDGCTRSRSSGGGSRPPSRLWATRSRDGPDVETDWLQLRGAQLPARPSRRATPSTRSS